MPHPVDVSVGIKLREFRILNDLSQQALAKSIGISFQQIQKYENGANRISASKLFEFSKALGVHISEFFEDPSVSCERVEGITKPKPDTIKLISHFEKIDRPELRQHILSIVRQLSTDAGNAEAA